MNAQRQEVSAHCALYIKRLNMKIKVVDGSSLVVATVLNNIPKGTSQVLLRGKFDKVALAITNALCTKNVQVTVLYRDELKELEQMITMSNGSLALSSIKTPKIWLVGDEWDEDEQMQTLEGSLFIPFSRFPPKKMRKDCFYHYTPAMIAPPALINLHSCENWLPRRVMSAWRIAGIIHALEKWNVHECGDIMFDFEKIWEASIRHGKYIFAKIVHL
ncbi:hypothetical protein TSUD_272840 [Trifolium subterraneum]|uniref:Very-long-chain aldehyde decarbonylase CER1-like C-terminal domain-containing protein n=1 Tax=Trifolium subterraneum TaxID=3900 RepID=A0A2Z6PBS3_TRISU|nr:hypothetical protein TSUD_272840 [Trifolium subterraneum]